MSSIQRSFHLLKIALSLLISFVTERSVLIVLVFYSKGKLEEVTIQRTHQFTDLFLLSKEPS